MSNTIDITEPIEVITFTGSSIGNGFIVVIEPVEVITFTGPYVPIGIMNVIEPVELVNFSGYIPRMGIIKVTEPVEKISFGGYSQTVGIINVTEPVEVISFTGPGSSIIVYKAVILNTETHSISTYDNFNFNSFAKFNGVTLASSPEGLFLLDGDDDAGVPISAIAKTALWSFDTTNNVRIDDMIAYYKGPTTKVSVIDDGLNVVSDEITSFTSEDGVHPERLRQCKGNKSNAFGFDIENVDGNNLELKDLEVRVYKLRRKW